MKIDPDSLAYWEAVTHENQLSYSKASTEFLHIMAKRIRALLGCERLPMAVITGWGLF
jgi:hypothetical protein